MSKPLSRREFLAGVGGVGVAASAAYALGTVGATASASRISRVRDRQSPVTLSMWANHPEWAQQVQALVADFQKKYPYITIQITQKPGPTFPTEMTAALAAHSAPDIVGVGAGATYTSYVKGGHLHDLSGKIRVSALLPSATAAMYVDKKVYATPLFGEYTTGMFYWKPTFAKYKLEVPTTWSELRRICAILLKNGESPLQMGSADGTIPAFTWTGLMTTLQGTRTPGLVATGKAKLTDADFMSATNYLQSLVPYFSDGYASTTYVEGKNDFAEGKSVMIMGGSADYTGYKDANPDVEGRVSFFPWPHPDGHGVLAVNSGVDTLYGINTTVKSNAQIDAAIKFLNFFLTPEIGTKVANTIELPSVKGAKSKIPIQERIIEVSKNDAPEWFQYQQMGNFWTYATDHISDMFLKSVTPKQFAAACQATIK